MVDAHIIGVLQSLDSKLADKKYLSAPTYNLLARELKKKRKLSRPSD
jgi:hypothetical protein